MIDDMVAFAGGLDLTVSRWDTPAHRVDEPLRRCPGRAAYGPFHDVQRWWSTATAPPPWRPWRVRQLLGSRFPRLRRRLNGSSVLAFAALRMLPIAPFSVVNLLAGATGMSFSSYMVGTALGMAPGIAALAVATEGLARQRTAVALGALLATALLGALAVAGRLTRHRAAARGAAFGGLGRDANRHDPPGQRRPVPSVGS